jgi:hypothetical protein
MKGKCKCKATKKVLLVGTMVAIVSAIAGSIAYLLAKKKHYCTISSCMNDFAREPRQYTMH